MITHHAYELHPACLIQHLQAYPVFLVEECLQRIAGQRKWQQLIRQCWTWGPQLNTFLTPILSGNIFFPSWSRWDYRRFSYLFCGQNRAERAIRIEPEPRSFARNKNGVMLKLMGKANRKKLGIWSTYPLINSGPVIGKIKRIGWEKSAHHDENQSLKAAKPILVGRVPLTGPFIVELRQKPALLHVVGDILERRTARYKSERHGSEPSSPNGWN